LANGKHIGTNGGASTAQAGEDGIGGAIYNLGGTIRLVSCILSNNSALGGDGDFGSGAAGGVGRGGAVFNQGGRIYLDSVSVISNSVAGGLTFHQPFGPTVSNPGLGGALYTI